MRPRATAALLVFLLAMAAATAHPATADPADDPFADAVTQGALRVKGKDGKVVECPLEHTDVQATVSGFIARVRVTQQFANPSDEAIEAVYVFPLPHTSAVDDMTMVVGERRIVGAIKRRDEARDIYERALAQGMTASLLEQERPNIFTQSVGNIRPRQRVRIEISYVDVLAYDMGTYEFHFPMVVGPRYIPGPAVGSSGTGWAPDTTRVPDASRITPPVLPPGYRTGHDVSLSVSIDAGVPVRDVKVTSHKATLARPGPARATAVLDTADAIPNKDFVLRYKVAGAKPELAVLAHAETGEDGYFLLMVQPREMEEALKKAPPREVCFLIDVSGSMSGEPTAKVVETMRLFLRGAKPEDRIQVVTFDSATRKLFPAYVPASDENVARALRFTDGLAGGGGTEMLKGIRAVLADPVDPQRVRIVMMLTDGYIGNEAEIIREVGQRAGDQIRFWTVGIGSSPNRYLLDGVAKQGGGMSAVLGLRDDPRALVERITERIHRAQLGRIQIDWGHHAVYETYPARIPDLWGGAPVVVVGRYRNGGPSTIHVTGTAEGQPASFPVEVAFPDEEKAHGVLAPVWARKKIEDLSEQMIVADDGSLEEEITELALAYRLTSAYTSFVAVDESERGRLLDAPRPPRRIAVPVPMPEGVSYQGVFGEAPGEAEADEPAMITATRDSSAALGIGKARKEAPKPTRPQVAYNADKMKAPRGAAYANGPVSLDVESAAKLRSLGYVQGVDGGVAGGVPGGVVGGVVGGLPAAPPATTVPQPYGYTLSEDVRVAASGAAAFFQSTAAARHREAQHALARANTLAGSKDWRAARRSLQRAYLLEAAHRVGNPWLDDGTGAAIARTWAAVEQDAARAAAASLPALGRPLDLTIRNADLDAALASVGQAAGLPIHVVPGALDDVRSLVGSSGLRIAYLDLRHATAAQALTWLLEPVGLEWSVDGSRVTVTTARRAAGPSVWVYDVTPAAPRADEALAALEKTASQTLGAPALLVAPDRLFVEGDPAVHARAAALAETLRDGKTREALRAAAERQRAAGALEAFTWPLLTASLRNQVDDEAVSELLEAWRTPEMAAAAGAPGALLAARSAWVIGRARQARPEDRALATLADTAFGALAKGLAKAPPVTTTATPALIATQVYLALLRGMPDGVVPAALAAHLPARDAVLGLVPPTREMRDVAAALLTGAYSDTIVAGLAEQRLAGDDWLVLAAFALRQAGGQGWSRFREAKADIARATGASGAALRAVSRLDGAPVAAPPATKAAPKAEGRRGALVFGLLALSAAAALAWLRKSPGPRKAGCS